VLNFDWAAADVEPSASPHRFRMRSSTRSTGRWARPPRAHTGMSFRRVAPYGVLVALADLEPGTPGSIRRISEVAEHEAPALLLMLAEHSIKEGTEVMVSSTRLEPDQVAITIAARRSRSRWKRRSEFGGDPVAMRWPRRRVEGILESSGAGSWVKVAP